MSPLYLANYEMWQKWQTDYRLRYSLFYLKINDTVKLVKLFEKMFIWAQLFLIKFLEVLFPLISAVMKVYLRRQFETVDQLKRAVSDFRQ